MTRRLGLDRRYSLTRLWLGPILLRQLRAGLLLMIEVSDRDCQRQRQFLPAVSRWMVGLATKGQNSDTTYTFDVVLGFKGSRVPGFGGSRVLGSVKNLRTVEPGFWKLSF